MNSARLKILIASALTLSASTCLAEINSVRIGPRTELSGMTVTTNTRVINLNDGVFNAVDVPGGEVDILIDPSSATLLGNIRGELNGYNTALQALPTTYVQQVDPSTPTLGGLILRGRLSIGALSVSQIGSVPLYVHGWTVPGGLAAGRAMATFETPTGLSYFKIGAIDGDQGNLFINASGSSARKLFLTSNQGGAPFASGGSLNPAGSQPELTVAEAKIGIRTSSPSCMLDVLGGSITVRGSGAGFIVSGGSMTADGFRMVTNPVAGYVLTTDANGESSWQTPGATVLMVQTSTAGKIDGSSATATYLSQLDAAVQYLALSSAGATYLQKSSATAFYLLRVDADSLYLAKSSATATYLSQLDGTALYLTKSSGTATYLSQLDGASTYLTKSSATSTYLQLSSAIAVYLSQLDATATYLTKSSATSTYLQNSSATAFYVLRVDADSLYLAKTSATATYLQLSSAIATYISQTDAATLYLAKSSATSTYLQKSSATEFYLLKSSAAQFYSPLLAAGSNITFTPSGGVITIAATGGSGDSVKASTEIFTGGKTLTNAATFQAYVEFDSTISMKNVSEIVFDSNTSITDKSSFTVINELVGSTVVFKSFPTIGQDGPPFCNQTFSSVSAVAVGTLTCTIDGRRNAYITITSSGQSLAADLMIRFNANAGNQYAYGRTTGVTLTSSVTARGIIVFNATAIGRKQVDLTIRANDGLSNAFGRITAGSIGSDIATIPTVNDGTWSFTPTPAAKITSISIHNWLGTGIGGFGGTFSGGIRIDVCEGT